MTTKLTIENKGTASSIGWNGASVLRRFEQRGDSEPIPVAEIRAGQNVEFYLDEKLKAVLESDSDHEVTVPIQSPLHPRPPFRTLKVTTQKRDSKKKTWETTAREFIPPRESRYVVLKGPTRLLIEELPT